MAAGAALIALAAPAAAARPSDLPPARTYVAARAAALSGDHVRAARLFAALAESEPANLSLSRRAIGEAISAGDMGNALRIARRLPVSSLAIDARLLLVADELRRKRHREALALVTGTGADSDVAFLQPLIRAWAAAERKDDEEALGAVRELSSNGLLGAFANEQRALILLKLKRPAAAEPFARNAIENAGGRDHRLRLALADGFLAAGDRARAAAMIEGMGTELGRARARIAAGRPSGLAIDTAAKAYSEYLLGLAIDLNRVNSSSLPLSLAQIARHAAPDNPSTAVLLGILLDRSGRLDDALAAFRAVPSDSGLAAQALDSETQALVEAKRFDAALARARGALGRNADVSDHARLGDVLSAMDRHAEAADAYGRAAELAATHGNAERWPLLLLKASSLESANRWPDAKAALEAGLALAPDQPLLLNFLGYAKLERGEDLDGAEAMIRKASALAPDDASITDSLGWAQFKRGKVDEAIDTLQRAAAGDPHQAEIHEHLGDALFTAGRKFEARFAWQAALITADEEIAPRVKAKIESGLTPATAAP